MELRQDESVQGKVHFLASEACFEILSMIRNQNRRQVTGSNHHIIKQRA